MKTAQLVYSIICDDVRIEMGNKLSLMGVFENIFFQTVPIGSLEICDRESLGGRRPVRNSCEDSRAGPEGSCRVGAFEVRESSRTGMPTT